MVKNIPDSTIDGILYDTYPLSEKDLHIHQFAFLKEAKRMLKQGGVVTYCNLTSWGNLRDSYDSDKEFFKLTQEKYIREAGFTDIDYEVVKVFPPATCEYYSFSTAVAPIIKK